MIVDNIKISWSYDFVEVERRVEGELRLFKTERTICHITPFTKRLVPELPNTEIVGDIPEIARGEAICSVFDTHVKEKGRRVSLTKALASFGWYAVEAPADENGIRNPSRAFAAQDLALKKEKKTFRTKIWEAYRMLNPVHPKWKPRKILA